MDSFPPKTILNQIHLQRFRQIELRLFEVFELMVSGIARYQKPSLIDIVGMSTFQEDIDHFPFDFSHSDYKIRVIRTGDVTFHWLPTKLLHGHSHCSRNFSRRFCQVQPRGELVESLLSAASTDVSALAMKESSACELTITTSSSSVSMFRLFLVLCSHGRWGFALSLCSISLCDLSWAVLNDNKRSLFSIKIELKSSRNPVWTFPLHEKQLNCSKKNRVCLATYFGLKRTREIRRISGNRGTGRSAEEKTLQFTLVLALLLVLPWVLHVPLLVRWIRLVWHDRVV